MSNGPVRVAGEAGSQQARLTDRGAYEAGDLASREAIVDVSRTGSATVRVSERLQAGMVGLNRGAVSDPAAPFGGMKQSGLGREGASEGIYEFCETQYIATNF